MPVAPEVFPPVDDQVALAVERRLVEVAQRFGETLRDRVTMLLLAAAEAIVKLGEVDFVRYEADEEQGGHTLALWEEMAPVTGSTVQHVNEVVAGATAQFPPPPESSSEDDLDAAFGPASEAPAATDQLRSTEEEIAGITSEANSFKASESSSRKCWSMKRSTP